MVGGTGRKLDRKRSHSPKKNNTSLATNKKNDRTHKNKTLYSKKEVRRTRSTRSYKNFAKKADGVEESEDDDTQYMNIKQVIQRHRQRNERKRKPTIRHAEKDKVVHEHPDGNKKQKKTREEYLAYHATRMKRYYHAKDPEEKQVMLDKKALSGRRTRAAKQHGIVNNMGYRDVLDLWEKNELIYIDATRSFELNLPGIQARKSNEFIANGDTADSRLIPSLQHRIVDENVEDGINYTNVRFNNVELRKLSICSKFIFGHDDIPSNANSDSEHDNGESKIHDTVARSVPT